MHGESGGRLGKERAGWRGIEGQTRHRSHQTIYKSVLALSVFEDRNPFDGSKNDIYNEDPFYDSM